MEKALYMDPLQKANSLKSRHKLKALLTTQKERCETTIKQL